MKTLLFLIQLTAVIALYSPSSYADHDHGHHRGHHKHHHDYYDDEPEPRYYSQPPRQQDPRSHQGLAGGVVGSVLGYEIGNGDPIATGLGAAAGSYLGNGIAGRR